MNEVDFRQQNLNEIPSSKINSTTNRVLLSYNQLTSIPRSFFFSHHFITFLDLSHNNITDISALNSYRCIEYLNLSSNNIDLQNLLPIRKVIILNLNIENTPASHHSENCPLILPALLKHAHIINGIYISDSIRTAAAKYRNSQEFGRDMMHIFTNYHVPVNTYSSLLQNAKLILKNEAEGNSIDSPITPPGSDCLLSLDEKPQILKLDFLSTKFPIDIPEGTIEDYYGIILGLLGSLWMNHDLDSIPRLLCRGYWFTVSDQYLKLEQWQQYTLLHQIMMKVESLPEFDNRLFEALKLQHFLITGTIPLIGSTARMIVTAFIARAIATSTIECKNPPTEDLRVYFRYRRVCGFTLMDYDYPAIFAELIDPLYEPENLFPIKDDPIEYVNPLSGAWEKSTIFNTKAGRVFIKSNELVIQLPIMAVFWDARGTWRETSKKIGKVTRTTSGTEVTTFLTEAEVEAEAAKIIEEVLQKPVHPPDPPMPARVAQPNVNEFIQTAREANANSPFIVRQTTSRSVSFKGVVNPRFRARNTARAPRRIEGKTTTIDDVVNITPGAIVGDGDVMKKFYVRKVNERSGRSSYSWVSEENLTPEETARLVKLHERHVQRVLGLVQ